MESDHKPFSLPTDGSCVTSCSSRLLWLAFLVLSVAGWVRLADTMINWYWLKFAGVVPGALYLAITGALWGVVGLFAALWILQGRSWGRLVGLAAVLFFVLTYWVDRLFIAQDPGTSINTPFALSVTLLVVLVALLILQPFAALRSYWQRRATARPTEQ